MNQDKKACLEQLKLTKMQLIWNREAELKFIEELDKPELTRMELSGKVGENEMREMKGKVLILEKMKKLDIERAEEEIKIIDKMISELS